MSWYGLIVPLILAAVAAVLAVAFYLGWEKLSR